MIDPMPHEAELLRVAYPRARNTQQTGRNDATTRATTTQQPGLKALALRVLSCNNPRNTRAHNTPKTAQQTPIPRPAVVAQETGPEVVALLRCPRDATRNKPEESAFGIPDTVLASVAADIALRESGKRPADETAPALCRSCGPVWIAPEIARIAPTVNGWPRVLGCPWCHVKNRDAIPRPEVSL